MSDFTRMWLGILLCVAAFWLAIARTMGAFGTPDTLDGSVLLILLLAAPGLYLVATQLDRDDANVSRETLEEKDHGTDR